MKNHKGFAPLIVLLVVVLLGAGTYAVVNRNVLKSYFQTGDKPTSEQKTASDETPQENTASGDKPTESQFNSVIDSALNLSDDKKKANPTNVAPENKTVYTPAQAEKGLAFRWTPLVPKPKEPVSYRLRVWQLMQGQNGTQAMRTNKPVVTKDVSDVTETTASNIYTGPCKPPYLCDFVWSIEATVGGTLSGSSEPSTFSVAEEKTSAGANVDVSAGTH